MNAHNEQQSIIAGALFDLMGYLTCREKKLHLSASDDAAPAVEALTEWAERRGFDLDEARVTDWQAALAAQPSPVVKQNLTTQPSAAQEAAPWRDHDAAIDAKALSTATEIALMWGQDRSQFISRIQVAVIDAMRWVKGGLQTAAAPGIDLEQFRDVVDYWLADAEKLSPGIGRNATIAYGRRLLALIDASPKGATFSNDGNSEAQFIADGERLNCSACGGSGHVEDSPKGGSEAPTYTTGHCENHRRPGGCPLHNLQCGYPQCDRRQAGDADVRHG